MSDAPDNVPDDSSYGRLSAALWGLVIFAGVALFLWDFLGEISSLGTANYPLVFINNLKLTLVTLSILGGGGTVVLIGYVVYRYASPNRDAPDRLEPGEGKYTLSLYAVGLVFLMAMTIFMGASTLAQTDEAHHPAQLAGTDSHLDVQVVGSQWIWRASVDGVPYDQTEEIVVPSKTLIRLDITSADVIHSFAIQELGIKKDAVPGQTNSASFMVADVQGETTISAGGQTFSADVYQINCAELCGKGHSKMVAKLYVVSPDDYAAWVEAKGGSVPDSMTNTGGS